MKRIAGMVLACSVLAGCVTEADIRERQRMAHSLKGKVVKSAVIYDDEQLIIDFEDGSSAVVHNPAHLNFQVLDSRVAPND